MTVEACILAGGLSSRMGRDKARIRLGRKTMLGRIRKTAIVAGLPVRVVTRDIVPGCGPLGGILTALTRTRAEKVLFLACDMPMVGSQLLAWLAKQRAKRGLFVVAHGQAGFPLLLPRAALGVVKEQLENGRFAVHSLARKMRAKHLKAPARWLGQLVNINTRDDLRRLLLVKEKFVT